jgi:hypothetical protein
MSEYQLDITWQQSPILVQAALAIFIGGVALASWQLLGLVSILSSTVNLQTASFWDLYNRSFGFIDLLSNLPGLLFSFFTGIAMILGSYFGMKDVWSAWLDAAEKGKKLLGDEVQALGEFSTPEPATVSESERPATIYTSEGWARKQPGVSDLEDFILAKLEKSKSKEWVVDSVALAHGLKWQVAHSLVDEVATAHGIVFKDEITYGPPVVFSTLGVFLSGLVITAQYLVLAVIALGPKLMQAWWSYRIFNFLNAVGKYIGNAPGAFALFALGFAMFVGGLFALRVVGPSVYRWEYPYLGKSIKI